jgi:hypothetical protein
MSEWKGLKEKLEKDGRIMISPSLEVRNKTGELIFALKSKEKYDYYLFELHRDRMEPEDQVAFNKVWFLLRSVARELNIPLHDIADVQQKFEEKIEELGKAGRLEPNKTVDVKIEIFDHAFETMRILTIGVTPKEKLP